MRPSLLFAWVAVVAAQQDPIEDFCRRHQHQTCVIDDKLYIDGGKVFYGGSIENGSIAQQNTRLLWENVLATDNETEFPTQYKNLTKHSEVPSEIRVFDINENKWFTQIASGDVPSPRRGVCAGVAWANDHSSYNIYVQGGVRDDGATFGETYILTIPSFQWILIYPEPSRLPNIAAGKGWSSCNVVRRSSQMIIIGGYYANASFTQCDVPKYYGQHGLLLGQESAEVAPPEVKWFWRFWSGYNKYRVPDKIVSLIGGNTDGHATRTMPLQGWTTPSPLGPYFQHLNWEGPRTASRALPGTPTASNQPTQNSQSGPNVGAIAGGTVGGVVALVALISTIFFCLHCRHSREAPNQSQTELDSNTKSELDGFHKSNPSHTGSEGGTEMSSTGSATSCSPQFSLPHGTNSWNRNQAYYQVSPPQRGEEWTQQGAYYPPPPDLSQAYKHPHEISAELPEARSPVNAELSDLSSPAYADLPDSRGV
ncbi:uncharacterized protein EKO05_0001773 [Ascochyta rabiei]|uniref:uncharacterized protein n=1 Tax=Didymella rabiei TaxID=5454 RepID=UPI0021F98741|nr:uncharacterized protein EKO05_0001773 [Ascochyta rabiei]UPX11151.1 hypothetical protein EKO05_0001773 [Ascochyta rabiei]